MRNYCKQMWLETDDVLLLGWFVQPWIQNNQPKRQPSQTSCISSWGRYYSNSSQGFGFEVLNAFKFKQWKPTTVKSWLFIMNEIILWPNICLIPDKTCQNVITKLVNLISLGCFEWKLNSSIFRGQVARKNYETKKWPGQTWKGIFREIFNI